MRWTGRSVLPVKQLVVMMMENVLSATVLGGFISDQDTDSYLIGRNKHGPADYDPNNSYYGCFR